MNTKSVLVQFGKAVLVWIATNAFGTLLVTLLHPILTVDEIFKGVSITLLFSSPAVVLLVPIAIQLERIQSLQWKVIFAVMAVLLVCTGVIVSFISILRIPASILPDLASLVVPYFVAAQLSFLTFNIYTLK